MSALPAHGRARPKQARLQRPPATGQHQSHCNGMHTTHKRKRRSLCSTGRYLYWPQQRLANESSPELPNYPYLWQTTHYILGNSGPKWWYNGANSHCPTVLPLLCKFNTHSPSKLTASDQILTHQMMMLIAPITIKSGFVLLVEGLCAQILCCRFEIISSLR